MSTKFVEFKSNADNWKVEWLGLKCNTIRKCNDKQDKRFDLLENFCHGELNLLNIEIKNKHTGESFIRQVTDVSKWDGYYIISWRHD